MEAVRTSETSVDNHFTRQYIPEDNSEHHTRRRENLKSHRWLLYLFAVYLMSLSQ
jgi:predicted anti-sigma-YlaC factor YlaD